MYFILYKIKIEAKMFGRKTNKIIKAASDNKIGSENTIKNTLINFDVDFNGLEKVIALFFPTVRHEMIIRYRAETIAKIGNEAYRIARDEDIQVKPIPPKIALPLIEKMSLEHEPDMYEKWAKLLIAAGVNANPIHQQYADLLLNLDNKAANLLKEIYIHQSKSEIENVNTEKWYDEYVITSQVQKCFKDINQNIKMKNMRRFEKNELIPEPRGTHYFEFPLFFSGSEKIETLDDQNTGDVNNEPCFTFTNDEKNRLLCLEKLGLIKYQFFLTDRVKDKDDKYMDVLKCGAFLTHFGYSFVDCLEHPVK